MKTFGVFLTALVGLASLAFSAGQFIGYVQVNPASQQSGGFNLSSGTVSSLTVSSATVSNATIQNGTMSGQLYGSTASVQAPGLSFANDKLSGFYAKNDSSHTVIYVSSGFPVMTIWGDHQNFADGSPDPHLQGGSRPGVYIGPTVMWSSGTQPGEQLNVWNVTDGNGPQPQVDVLATNFGKGDARLLAQASLADTPNTTIGYVAAYGSGHGGTRWSGGYSGGGTYPWTVSFISQAPIGNFFEMTTASQTYFYNWNNTHANYHFLHGSAPAADDWTVLDGSMTVTGYFQYAPKTKAALQALSPSAVGQSYYCVDCSTAVLCISSGTSTNQWFSSTSRGTGCQ